MGSFLRSGKRFQITFQQIYLFIVLTGFTTTIHGANFYWVGGSGSWRSFNQHWATTSGGQVFYDHEPTQNDDVFFDANSFTTVNQTVKLDSGIYFCRNMNWTGVQFTPTFSAPYSTTALITLKIYGSLITVPTMKWLFYQTVSFESASKGNLIIAPPTGPPNYNVFKAVNFNGVGGEWILGDSLNVTEVKLSNGTFRSNNHRLNCGTFFTATNYTGCYLGTSRIRAGSYTAYLPAGAVMDADSTDIIVNSEFKAYGVQQYNNITFLSYYEALEANNSKFRTVTAITGPFYLAGTGNVVDFFLGKASSTIYYSNTIKKAEFRNDVYLLDGSTTFDTIILNNPNKVVTLAANTTQYVNGTIITIPSTCSDGTIKIVSKTAGTQATIRKTTGSVNCSNLVLQDINVTGGASFTAINSIVVSNVTGWTITEPTPRSVYWVGGTGNWSDPAHWSLTSGGTGGACLPTIKDDVIFDSKSFTATNQKVTVDQEQASCNSILFTGVLFNPTVLSGTTINLNVYGNYTLSPNMIWSFNGTINFKSQIPGNTIHSAKQSLAKIKFDGTGSWILQDSINVTGIDVTNGSLNTNGKLVRCSGDFTGTSSFPRSVLLGNSSVYCNLLEFYGFNMTVQAGSSTIYAKRVAGRSLKMHNVVLYLTPGSESWEIVSVGGEKMEFDTLTCEANAYIDSGDRQLKIKYLLFKKQGTLTYGSTVETVEVRNSVDLDGALDLKIGTLYLNNPGFITTINGIANISNQLIANGSCMGGYITIQSKWAGSTAYINKPSGIVNCDRIILKDITAQGGATFNATNAVNGGNVQGWNFGGVAARTLYWVGNSGNWSSAAHWSSVSGGTGGVCPPTLNDHVIFDTNSFSVDAVVNADVEAISCKNMLWQNYSKTATFTGTSGSLSVYGSFRLNPNVSWDYTGQLKLVGSGRGKEVATASCAVHDIIFEGPGSEWVLQDSLTCDNLTLANGRLRCPSNFYTLRCLQQINIFDTDTLELGTTSVYAFYWTNYINPEFSNTCLFDAGTSTIHCYQFNGTNQTYYKLDLTSTFGYGILMSNRCTFKDATFSSNEIEFYQCSNNIFEKARFNGNVSLKGNATFGNAIFNNNLVMNDTNSFDTLTFNNPGKTATFVTGQVQTVKKSFSINSYAQNKINLKSSAGGVTATLSIPPADSCFDHLTLQDMIIASGSRFHAGSHSINLGNNSNCVFTDCISPISKVWPGDTNNDTLVDCKDLLNIGLAYGERGSLRPNASLAWGPQPALDWNTIFSNFVNVKHADCNGNGIVDSLDLEAVRLNYSKTHPAQRGETPVQGQKTVATQMDLSMVDVLASYPSGTIVSIPLVLKPTSNPSTQVYGVAFDMEYDKHFVQEGSVSLTYENSWLVPAGNRIQLQKDFYTDETHMVAFSRINKISTSGNGIVTWLHFKIKSNVSGTFPLSIGNVRAVDASGAEVSIGILSPQVTPGIAASVQSRPNSSGTIAAYIVVENLQNITLSPLTNPVTCPGNTMNIAYTATGVFNSSNVFTAELSDGNGNFDHPVIIGSNSTSNTMNVVIPGNTPASNFYRIRVTSSSPALESEPLDSVIIGTAPATPGIISGPANVCAVKGTSTVVTYTIQPVMGASAYNWIVPAGVSITSGQGSQHVSVIYSSGFTSGTISVSAVNTCGTGPSRSLAIGTITDTPLGISGPVNACPFINSGTNAIYSIAPVAGASSYQWTVPSGASIVSGQGTTTLTVKFTTSFSAGTIGVSSKSGCGNSAVKLLAISKLVPGVPVAITGPLNVCSFVGTSTAAVYSIDDVANAVSYSWTVPANATVTSGQGSKTITVLFSGSFTGGNLSVKAVASCASSAAKTIKLIKTIPATPGVITGPTNACPYAGSSTNAVYSIAAVAGADSYSWTVPANATIVSGQGTTQLTVSYSTDFTAGSITVNSTVTCGSSGSRSLAISKTIPAMPASITGPANVCTYAGSTTYATYTARAVSGASSYNWTVPSNASIVAGQGTTQISVSYSGNFTSGSITVQSVVSCGSSSAKTFAVTKTVPAAPAAITGPANACSYIGTKNNAAYSIAAVTDASSYEWVVPAYATIVSGQGKTRIVVKFAAGYTTGLISVKSIAACGSSNTTTLQVTDCSNTPRIVAAEFAAGMMVSDVYPNPSHEMVNLEIESDHTAELRVDVTDFTGKLLTTRTTTLDIGRNLLATDVYDYTPGIYFIRLINKETGESLIKKIVKQ